MASLCSDASRSKISAEYWAIAKCSGGWRRRDGLRDRSRRLVSPCARAFGRSERTRCISRCRRPAACVSQPTITDTSPGCCSSRPSRSPSRANGRFRNSPADDRRWGERTAVLAGRPGAGGIDRGATFAPASASARTRFRSGCARLLHGRGRWRSDAGGYQLRILPARDQEDHP